MSFEPKRLHLEIETPDNSRDNSDSSPEDDERKRKRNAAEDDAPGSDSDSTSDGEAGDDSDADIDVVGQLSPADREIQVEFEARSPQDCDYFGLVHLLKLMLRPTAVNVSDLAERIISQRTVGSVITQSHGDDDDDDSDDENGAGGGGVANGNGDALQPNNEVFGVGTILKLEHGHHDSLGDSLVSHLLVNTASSEKAAALRAFFNDPSKSLGFLISERILNMPPQISVPLYETLLKEIRKAVAKNLPFDFTHYVLISRQFISPEDESKVIFTNAEEEVFVPECDLVLDMDCGAGMPSTRTNAHVAANTSNSRMVMNQDEYIEKRKLLIFKSHKLEKITSLVKGAFPIN